MAHWQKELQCISKGNKLFNGVGLIKASCLVILAEMFILGQCQRFILKPLLADTDDMLILSCICNEKKMTFCQLVTK